MQDYSSLGITSIPDRKKLFQVIFHTIWVEIRLVLNRILISKKLVQTLRQEIPTLENGLVSNKTPIPTSYRHKSPPVSNATPSMPDLSNLALGRRGSSQQPLPLPQIPTRSRSRTLPTSDSHYGRPDFSKSNSNSNFLSEDNNDESDESDDSDKCEIRRGSGPLLDPYGVPIQKLRYKPAPPPFSLPVVSSPLQQSQQLIGQSDLNQKIRVCVRKRPLNKKELERAEKDIAPTSGVRSINVNEPKYVCIIIVYVFILTSVYRMKVDLTKYIEQHNFTFDDVFDSEDSNEKIYQRTAQPLVKYVFDGGKATCFA